MRLRAVLQNSGNYRDNASEAWYDVVCSIRCLPRVTNANRRLLKGFGVSRMDLPSQRQLTKCRRSKYTPAMQEHINK
jgi:hypothetical protein